MRLRTLLLGATAAGFGLVVAGRRRADDEVVAGGDGAVLDAEVPSLADVASVPAPPRPSVAETLATVQRGASEDERGGDVAVRLDLDRARAGQVEPVVEFLTFVQEQRGDTSHLLFVRYDDLDALAAAEGQKVAEFLSRLDQLGVVVSTN